VCFGKDVDKKIMLYYDYPRRTKAWKRRVAGGCFHRESSFGGRG